MDRQEYKEVFAAQIRRKRASPLVIKELELHIEEQKADFIGSVKGGNRNGS